MRTRGQRHACHQSGVALRNDAHATLSDGSLSEPVERIDYKAHKFGERGPVAARQDVLNGGYFARVGCIGVADIPEATALAGSG